MFKAVSLPLLSTERGYSVVSVLLLKHKPLCRPHPLCTSPQTPQASQRGETQTRVQRAPSTPQPLNTYSALPFEKKPCQQALSTPDPPSVSYPRLVREHTCCTLHWELFGDFPVAVPGSRCENGGNQAWCFIMQRPLLSLQRRGIVTWGMADRIRSFSWHEAVQH